jgi:hypothetical protein
MAGTKRKAPRNKRAFLFGRCHDKATARKFGGSSAGLCSEGVLWVRCGCDISKASEKNWIEADAV